MTSLEAWTIAAMVIAAPLILALSVHRSGVRASDERRAPQPRD
jgi:hypothetical protein